MMTTKRVSITLLATTAAIAFVGAANAQEGQPEQQMQPEGQEAPAEFMISTEGWDGGAYADEAGEFSHCGISRDVTDTMTVVFSLNPRQHLNIGLLSATWEMSEGTQGEVSINIDGGTQREIGALPAAPNLLIVPAGSDDELVEQIMRGRTLTMEVEQPDIGDETVELPLTGTFAGLSALRSCIQTALDMGVADPERFDPAPATATVDPSQPMDRDTLIELMRAAGFQEVRFAEDDQVPQDELELAQIWQAGPVVGGLHQSRRDGEAIDIDPFADNYVDILEERCSGEFERLSSQTDQFRERYAVRQDNVQCLEGEDGAHVSLFFSLDDFHYSAFFHEGDLEVAEVAEEATGRLAQVIRSIAGFDEEGE